MEYIKVKDICDIRTGKYDANHAEENGKYKFFTCALLPMKADTYSFEGNLVMLPGNGANLGEIMYYEGKIEAYQRTYVLHNIKIKAKYLYYYLKLNWKRYILRRQIGSATNYMKLEDILNFEIPNITLEIQEKIISILDYAQELINKRKEQIKALDQLVKSKFIEMFGDLSNEDKLPLESCTKFIDYRGKTPTLSESGIRIINAKSVGTGFFKYIDEYISGETYNEWMRRGFPVAGDVLFVTEGHTFGNVCRIPRDLKKFAMGQRVITMQGKSEVLNNAFLAQYMQGMAFKIDIDKYKTGSSAQGIRSKELQKILIPIPDLELQNKFADFINHIDKLKFEMEKSLKELEDNFNALMQKAFNGELFK